MSPGAGAPTSGWQDVPDVLLVLAVAAVAADALVAVLAFRRRAKRDALGERIARRPWGWAHALFLLALLLLGLFLGQAVLRFGSPGDPERGVGSVPAAIASFALVYGAVMAGVFSLTGLRRGVWSSALGLADGRLGRDLLRGGVCALAILPPLWVAQAGNAALLERLGIRIGDQPAFQLLLQAAESPWYWQALVAIVAIAAAPVAEEIVFRGVLLPVVVRRVGTGPGILLTAVAFAALHLHAPSILPLLVLAVGLGMAYIAWGSITVPIVMHAVYNLIQVAVFFPLHVEYGPSV